MEKILLIAAIVLFLCTLSLKIIHEHFKKVEAAQRRRKYINGMKFLNITPPKNYHEFSRNGAHFIIEAKDDETAWKKARDVIGSSSTSSLRKVG